MKRLPWFATFLPVRRVVCSSVAILGGALFCILPMGLSAQRLSFQGPAPLADFGSINLCGPGSTAAGPCEEKRTLSFNVAEGGALGKIAVLTGGAPDLDFTLAAGSTCVGVVVKGTTCSVNVKFRPRFAGTRPGGVLIEDESGRALTTTLIRGSGNGAQIGFDPAYGVQIGSDFSFNATAVAVDNAGNTFITDATNARVLELQPDGTQVALPFSGLSFPDGIAVDGAGDLFVADGNNNQVIELSADRKVQTTLPFNGLSAPESVTVDAAGNVFVVGYYNPAVFELPAGAQAQVQVGGDINPGAVGVDGDGDLFVTAIASNSMNFYNEILEIPAAGGDPKTLGTGDYWNRGVLVLDGPGNIYTTDYSLGSVLEIPYTGGAPIQIVWGYTVPYSLSVTPAGDISMLDLDFETGASQLFVLPRSTSAPLDFGSVPVGKTATLPLPVTNIGNQPLVLTPFFKSPSYKIASTLPDGCMAGTPVGKTCTLEIEFSALTEGEHKIALTLRSNGAADASVELQGSATHPQ